jgi:hypothetical protein
MFPISRREAPDSKLNKNSTNFITIQNDCIKSDYQLPNKKSFVTNSGRMHRVCPLHSFFLRISTLEQTQHLSCKPVLLVEFSNHHDKYAKYYGPLLWFKEIAALIFNELKLASAY